MDQTTYWLADLRPIDAMWRMCVISEPTERTVPSTGARFIPCSRTPIAANGSKHVPGKAPTKTSVKRIAQKQQERLETLLKHGPKPDPLLAREGACAVCARWPRIPRVKTSVMALDGSRWPYQCRRDEVAILPNRTWQVPFGR